jgi:ferritin
MISKKMQTALNKQINKELYSSYLYLAMAADCREKGWNGVATWLEIQAGEENGHAMKFYKYMAEQGAGVQLDAIAKPPASFESVAKIFDATLEHERFITKSIGELVELAVAEKDHATQIMLQWFVTEQVEEEAHASEIVQKIGFVGGDARGLFLIDRELGARKG